MSRKFTIIAHARSGSTLLCRKLSELTDGKVFLEIFHHDLKVIRHQLLDDGDAVCDHFLPLRDEALRTHLASHPMALLNYLSELNPGRDLFFKVFPGHLQRPALRKVIKQSAGVIILERNLLHSFISSRIARRIKKWTTVDTSNQKITFDPDDFLSHIRQVATFYTSARTIAGNQDTPCIDVPYEMLAKSGDPVLRAALEGLSVAHRNGKVQTDSKMQRQDTRILASDKVENPDEMQRFLDARGLDNANDGRVSLPLACFEAALHSRKP